MEWLKVLTIIGSILIPMLGGFWWIISTLMEMQRKFGEDIRTLDTKMSHLEGYIEGRNYKKIITGTHDE